MLVCAYSESLCSYGGQQSTFQHFGRGEFVRYTAKVEFFGDLRQNDRNERKSSTQTQVEGHRSQPQETKEARQVMKEGQQEMKEGRQVTKKRPTSKASTSWQLRSSHQSLLVATLHVLWAACILCKYNQMFLYLINCLPTIDHRPSTIDHRPPTIGHRPSTIDHRPSTVKAQRLRRIGQSTGAINGSKASVPVSITCFQALSVGSVDLGGLESKSSGKEAKSLSVMSWTCWAVSASISFPRHTLASGNPDTYAERAT